MAKTEEKRIVGFALIYSTQYHMGQYVESIQAGALDGAIMDDVRCLRDHDGRLLLARTTSGTLQLIKDKKGLLFKAILPQTNLGFETAELITRGDLTQCSWGFQIAKGGEYWTETKNGSPLRVITKIKEIFDVSVVSFPANAATYVQMDVVGGNINSTFDHQARVAIHENSNTF